MAKAPASTPRSSATAKTSRPVAEPVAAAASPAGKTTAKTAPVKKTAKKAPTKKAPTKKAPTKKAPTKKVAAGTSKRSPFGAAWLRSQEAELRAERATYLHQAESLQAEADALVADFQSGDAQFDEDGGEGDTLSSERERDLALSAQARAAIEEIDHALGKFALGTYGICEASGEPIPRERLEAIPWARVQVQYKVGGIGAL